MHILAYAQIKKAVAHLLLVTLLISISLPSVLALTTTGFSYYSDILRAAGIIERDFSSASQLITRADALRIGV